jgi:predicted Zn-dependent protease
MKRSVVFVAFFLVLGFALAGLYWSQRRPKSTPVSANAVLNMAADAQRDLTRIPMHFTRLSDEQEIAIGRELAARYARHMRERTPEEEGLGRYVSRVGGTVAVHAHRHLPYTFTVLPDHNMINAFSLPGGPVYIGEGMLDLMLTEDELANVLAHEIEHIDHYHCVERVQLEAKLKNLNLDVLGSLVQIPLDFWEAGYHKDEEFEADREGMLLAVRSGYSPYGAVDTFTRFAKLCNEYVIHAQSPDEELSELAIQSLTGYFRSHPLPSERLAQANRLIVEQHWEDRKAQRPFRVEYEVHNGEFVKK